MKKKRIISIIVFIIGIIALIVGIVFLVLDLTKGPNIQDGEYLVSAKAWILENDGTNCENSEEDGADCADDVASRSVIWKFTEIGKGSLTTNNHVNDYDFIWAIEDGKLKIETDWLYALVDEYDYEINQREGLLILKNGENEFRFVAEFETE